MKPCPPLPPEHQGHPAITTWCPNCECRVVPSDDDRCLWCGTRTGGDLLSRFRPRTGRLRMSPAELLRLREEGCTHNEIVRIARLFYGVETSEGAVRSSLRMLGAPTNPQRVAAARRQWATQKETAA